MDIDDVTEAFRERNHFSIFDTRSGYHVDCKGAYTTREQRAIAERRRVRIGQGYIYVDAPENAIVAKLLFGSDQDILDAEAVYVRQRKRVSVGRIERRAREAGVLREWRALRRRADRILAEETR